MITPVHASFIQNIEGSICESPITMNDLKNTVELTKDIVMSSNASMAVKIVNLRKYVELTKPEFGTSAIYEVLSNVIHGRQNPIYKDGQEISADVLEQGMREVSQYIPNKSYTDLINGTSTEILISSMSSDDLYHRIISIRLLFERVEGTLSLLRKKYPAACKFVNETNHVENDYIYQLDPRKYFGIPNYYLQQIENFIQENKETILAGNILTENTELDQIGDELKNEGITDVVILTCKSEFKSILKENSDNGTFKKKVFTTCRKFKGLEADAIILIDVDEDTFGSEAVQRFYVGASRARLRLEIVTTMTDENCEKVLREVVDYKKKIKNAKRELALAFNAMPIIE